MCFSVLTLPAIAAMASANPIAAPAEGGLFARDEYRWCLGEKINSGSLRKFKFRMRSVDTNRICSGDPFGGINDCLWNEGCGPSGGGCEYSERTCW
ncbi:hypothetical protein Q7P35_004874 [Cladosporium inversicolor]